MVRIGQFNHPENGGLYGRPGDQLFPANGKTAYTYEAEVNITAAGSNWQRIFRAVDPDVAEDMSYLMERTARNPHVGYSQGETRYTFGNALRDAANDPDQIRIDCNADCSSGTAAIANAAGCQVNPGMTTATEKSDLMASRKFMLIEEPLRLKPQLFAGGDILWRQGHTAIVIGEEDPDSEIWLYMMTTGRLSMRLTPSGIGPKIGEIPAGERVIAFEPFLGPKNWAPILWNGRRCWASLKWLRPLVPDAVVKVTGSQVNIRRGPYIGSQILEVASIGDLYIRSNDEADEIDERGIRWYAVYQHQRPGVTGYISSKYAEVWE